MQAVSISSAPQVKKVGGGERVDDDIDEHDPLWKVCVMLQCVSRAVDCALCTVVSHQKGYHMCPVQAPLSKLHLLSCRQTMSHLTYTVVDA